MRRVLLASSNPGKLAELRALLADFGIEVAAAAEYALESVAETGLTFVENALLKARHGARISGLPTIADDSGLAVEALGGAPGIHSARYAGSEASDARNMEKLLRALAEVAAPQRGACFHCTVVCLRRPDDPIPLIGEGEWTGSILTEPRGSYGFGYDPLFYVPTHGCSAAELPPAVKNTLSHRARALRALAARLAERAGGSDRGPESW